MLVKALMLRQASGFAEATPDKQHEREKDEIASIAECALSQ